jgi:hypothetical protein
MKEDGINPNHENDGPVITLFLPLPTHTQDSERRRVVSMLAVSFRKSMSRSAARAISQRTTAISQHMSSSSTSDFAEVFSYCCVSGSAEAKLILL